jgi:hypothetical protein
MKALLVFKLLWEEFVKVAIYHDDHVVKDSFKVLSFDLSF